MGVPYSYQATATGEGAITWSLLSGPVGMTIDSIGLVAWLPDAAGVFNVSIASSNGLESATQSFSIDVVAVVPP